MQTRKSFIVRIVNAVVLLASITVPVEVRAAEVGDPQRGLAYAKEVCAKCHAVKAGDTFSPEMLAPTFTVVADTPGMNERALYVWLQNGSHESMPNLMIAPRDLDDVVAYIVSLRSKK